MGVYLRFHRFSQARLSFPHACGGVPTRADTRKNVLRFSPRMWGCTGDRRSFVPSARVFPTHVGVYLSVVYCVDILDTVFPTHVGVYLTTYTELRIETSLPHACGGVPCSNIKAAYALAFSPRMWGCTDLFLHKRLKAFVFPTHVGVYRRNAGRIP